MSTGETRRDSEGKRHIALGIACLLFTGCLAWFGLVSSRDASGPRPRGPERPELHATSHTASSRADASMPSPPTPRADPVEQGPGQVKALRSEHQPSPIEALPGSGATTPDRDRMTSWLASDDPRVRFEGLRLLAEAAPQEALYEIVAYVEDTRGADRAHLQRLSAVALLGELEGVTVAPQLTALYEADEPGVRRAAALALSRRGDETLVERELFDLRHELADPDGGVRARAAEQAAELASRSAIPVLLPLLGDSNSDVRAQAVDGLWRTADPSILPELERLLQDPVSLVRERAQRAIDALSSIDTVREPSGGR